MGCFTAPAVFSGHSPSDYWLFRRMQQVTGSSFAEIENWLQNESPPKTNHFFEMEFENCLREKVVGSDGQYFN